MSVDHPPEAPEASRPAADDGTGRALEPAPESRGAAAAPLELPRDELVFFSLIVAVFLVVLSVSYLDEDAFISFRVVDNFVHGHGLRWNIDERVQVFTNPLWGSGAHPAARGLWPS